MGNNASQELEDSQVVSFGPPTPNFAPNGQFKYTNQWSPDSLNSNHPVPATVRRIEKTTARAPRARSTGTASKQSIYEASSLYRRRMYAESLPKMPRPPTAQSTVSYSKPPRTLPPLHANDRNVAKYQPIIAKRSPSRSSTSYTRPVVAKALNTRTSQMPSLVCQQWNANNWTESGSVCSNDSTASDSQLGSSTKSTCLKSLPPLNNLRNLMEKFDSELMSSKATLKKGVERLTDTELLIDRTAYDQKQLLTKTEESVISTQTLLAKMHQHIANSHEFCNLLHRIDESLQTFSKAAYTVASWEQVRGDYANRPPTSRKDDHF